MYMLPIVLFRLLSLTFLYILILLTWWDFMGFWTMFFAIVPGVALVYVLGHPLLVFSSLTICTLLTLTILEIPVAPFLYAQLFWAIQLFIIFILVAISVYKTHRIPMGAFKKQDLLNRLYFSAEEMIVILNPVLHTIENVSPSIKKLYGWQKSELEGKSLHMIYSQDILDHPPKGFWESLHMHHQWCGSVEVITKDKVVCEEIAVYTVVVNRNNEMEYIEKKVLELFVKYRIPYQINWYNQFYDEIPLPLAVINKNHKIELANPHFIKEFTTTIIPQKTVFSELFAQENREFFNRIINESFSGDMIAVKHALPSGLGQYENIFRFSPYFCTKTRSISHILLIIIPPFVGEFVLTGIESQKTIALENNLLIVEDQQNILVLTLLKNIITEWYLNNNTTSVKLFTSSFKNFEVPLQIWRNFLLELFSFVENNKDDKQKKILISCHVVYSQCFFKISFEGTPYSTKENTMKQMKDVFEVIKDIATNYCIEEGLTKELVLSLEFHLKSIN